VNFPRKQTLKAMFCSLLVACLLAFSPVWVSAGEIVQTNAELVQAFQNLKVVGDDISAMVRFLWKNDEAWYTRWKMIEDAQKTIDCTYFIIDKDIFGQAYLGLLSKKARQGVKIRLMVDWRIAHSSYMKGVIDKLQEFSGLPNVQVKLYNSVVKNLGSLFTDFRKLAANNHDKIIITDEMTGIIGGRNIGADYYAGVGENPIVYRDSDVLMRGSHACKQLKEAFDEEWNYLKNTIVKPDKINLDNQSARLDLAYRVMSRYIGGRGLYNPKEIPNISDKLREALNEMNADVSKYKGITAFSSFDLWRGERAKPLKIIDKNARTGALNGITPALVKFIDASKDEILLQNPYVVLTEIAEAALERASKRGVKIVFHSNSGGSTDSLLPQAFLMNDITRLLQKMPTCRFLVAPTEKERLHSKVFVFDRQITVVGSYNMDPLSEQVNSEIVAAVNNKQFGTMVALRIWKDIEGRVVEYKNKVDERGNVVPAYGPENHLSPEVVKKMNLMRKLGWIRPLI